MMFPRAQRVTTGASRVGVSAAFFREWRTFAVGLGGLAILKSPAGRLFPKRVAWLKRARASWIYWRSLSRIRPRNPFERRIVELVLRADEYQLSEQFFQPEDAILDVGGHLGSFAYFCHVLGSRRIHCFEPDPANFPELSRALSDLPGITLHQKAVFRSDQDVGAQGLRHSGSHGVNTGAGSVLFGGRSFDIDRQREIGEHVGADSVQSVGLDEVLDSLGCVRLLKLDCEASEFPILLTSRRLDLVREIKGEYHEVSRGHMRLLSPESRLEGVEAFTKELLFEHLKAAGFRVEHVADRPHLGRFHAVREPRCPGT